MNSPLRYPGGKAKIYNYVKKIIASNFQEKPVYVEPFAGGSSLALKLLMNGVVSEIHINDLDESIYSFWYSIKHQKDELIHRIQEVSVTIDEWYRQRSIYFCPESSLIDKAFATFFLNRTNRSGVLIAGPIGGKSQSGAYKLDCRFNKTNLIKLIEKISSFSDKIHVYNLDGQDFVRMIDSSYEKSFIYLDPPYVRQGPSLYMNHFSREDHVSLFYTVNSLRNKWFVSYDNHELIRSLYSNFKTNLHDISYTLNNKRIEKELFIYSDNLFI